MFRRFCRRYSRSELAIRWLNFPVCKDTAERPGLLLIQVDGLAREEMERSLSAGRLRFLQSLIERDGYESRTFYSGLPSTTPAVQGELFYDVKTAVPSFSFLDRNENRIVSMFEPNQVRRQEAKLAAHAKGLLDGGSSWSNVYCGGAAVEESHFCVASVGMHRWLQPRRLLQMIGLAILNLPALIRIFGLVLLEFILGAKDALTGLFRGEFIILEGGMLLSRMCVGIGLREILTIGAKVDLARGLPIVHVNFLGYDEAAHLRGPDSHFARWTLRGIDRALKKLHRAAHRSVRRDYHVWIFSDHGQESTRSFAAEFAGGIHALIEQCMGGRPFKVAAMGPVGHLYFDGVDSRELAHYLVARGIPCAIARDEDGELLWFDRRGTSRLGNLPERNLNAYPKELRKEIAEDLARLASHPAAGRLIILGWSGFGDVQWVFSRERGSHGGLGPRETQGFLLTPLSNGLLNESKFIRPSTLRRAVFDLLSRDKSIGRTEPSARGRHFRLMTYNVHSCIGTDGRVSPRRIARLIAEQDPDIVAIQEVEHGRRRSRGEDQAAMIAESLGFNLVFCPTVIRGTERYGHAVLSRFPLDTAKTGSLPSPTVGIWPEPRSAIWTRVQGLNVVTTHLGLNPDERLTQTETLLGADWLDGVIDREPTLLCGDFNFTTQSRPYSLVTTRLRDAASGSRLRTFPSASPFFRIDHIFLSAHLGVTSIRTVKTELSRIASDHLPVVADLEILPG